ncbi:MAG: Crp/Fnr family transcriptional regulator [Trueperaceae bacterium]
MNQFHGIAERPSAAMAGQGRRQAARALPGGAFVGVALPEDEGMRVVAELPLERGRALYRDGDAAVSPYLVLRGVLRVSVPTASGRDRLADLAGAGDVLGIAAIDGARHAENVVAAADAVVAIIDLPETLARRSGRSALTTALVRQLTRSRALADDLGLPMGARICRILARLAERLGDPTDPGRDGRDGAAEADGGANHAWRHLPFSLTHDDVALLAGCARVTATRILGELKEAGVLDGRRGNYALVPAALIEAADRYVYDVL